MREDKKCETEMKGTFRNNKTAC